MSGHQKLKSEADYAKQLGRDMWSERKALGITRPIVAKILNVSVDTIRAWENGIRVLNVWQYKKIKELFDRKRKDRMR